MEPKIIKMKEIKVIGIVLSTSFKGERQALEIPPFFHKVYKEKKLNVITNRKNINQLCVIRFKGKDSPDFDYIMGTEVNNFNNIPDEMESLILPESEYVKMTIIKRGNEDVSNAFSYIIEKWLPESNYVASGLPGFIYYDDRFFSIFDKYGYEGNPIVDIYVSIKQK